MLQKYQFPLLFIAIFLVLQLVYWFLPDSIAKGVIVNQCTVKPSAWIINSVSSAEDAVKAVESSLISSQTRINVLKGCEGLEAIFLMIAAVLASRKPLKQTLLGLVGGFALVYVINQIRIVSLYYISYLKPEWFEPVHGYIAPLIIIGIAWFFYSNWLKLDKQRDKHAT